MLVKKHLKPLITIKQLMNQPFTHAIKNKTYYDLVKPYEKYRPEGGIMKGEAQ